MNMLASLRTLLFSSTAAPMPGAGAMPVQSGEGGGFAELLKQSLGGIKGDLPATSATILAFPQEERSANSVALAPIPDAEAPVVAIGAEAAVAPARDAVPIEGLEQPTAESEASPIEARQANEQSPIVVNGDETAPADAEAEKIATDDDVISEDESGIHENMVPPISVAIAPPVAVSDSPVSELAEQAEAAVRPQPARNGVPFAPARPMPVKSQSDHDFLHVASAAKLKEDVEAATTDTVDDPIHGAAVATVVLNTATARQIPTDVAKNSGPKNVDSGDPLPVTEGSEAQQAVDHPAAPVLNGKPLKAEALALLQLVRDQVHSGQSEGIAKPGKAVPAVSGKSDAASVEAGVNLSVPSIMAETSAPPISTSSPVPTQSPLVAPLAIDLSASLGAQMIDMGVSGQWIDGLARDIAGLSANGAQGRFQINADQLGAVQVDIRQGTEGAAISLTVANEAAELALRQDSDRLRLDAGLSAVRIAEVKIERASPVAEAARADTGGQQSSQQQSPQHHASQQPSGWQQAGHGMGQPQGQGRWQARENDAFSSKSNGDPAVLNHADARSAGQDGRGARYA